MTATTQTLAAWLLVQIADTEYDARDSTGWASLLLLRQCAAHLTIVEQLQRHERLVNANHDAQTEASRGGLDNQEQIGALRAHGYELRGRLEALRMAVDALATIYADRPGADAFLGES